MGAEGNGGSAGRWLEECRTSPWSESRAPSVCGIVRESRRPLPSSCTVPCAHRHARSTQWPSRPWPPLGLRMPAASRRAAVAGRRGGRRRARRVLLGRCCCGEITGPAASLTSYAHHSFCPVPEAVRFAHRIAPRASAASPAPPTPCDSSGWTSPPPAAQHGAAAALQAGEHAVRPSSTTRRRFC